MRRYRSQRIQKTLIALSGAALASSMMFASAQNIEKKNHNEFQTYYKTQINSQIHKAIKANKEQKHKNKRKINKIEKE
jgi:hypothetical protein